MTITEKQDKMCWQGCGEAVRLPRIEKGATVMENSRAVPQKIKRQFCFCVDTQENQKQKLRPLHTCVRSTIVHISQNVEATQVPIKR